MNDEPRIPEHLRRLYAQIADCLRNEDWITEAEAFVLNADRVAGGDEPLTVLQWRLVAKLASNNHPEQYFPWRRSVEQICNRAEMSEDPLPFL